MTSPARPDDLIRALTSGESARPRLIWHAPSERIELSGRVLATWASKIADLLQEEIEAGVSSRVALEGAPHWRLLAWALGAWTVGATVVTPAGELFTPGDDEADVLVADGTRLAADQPGLRATTVVGLTRASLARTSPIPLPAGVMDEAATVLTYADQVDPYDRAADDDPALEGPMPLTYAELLRPATDARIHVSGRAPLADVLVAAASSWAAGGSIVLTDAEWERSAGGDPGAGAFADTLTQEGVSALRD